MVRTNTLQSRYCHERSNGEQKCKKWSRLCSETRLPCSSAGCVVCPDACPTRAAHLRLALARWFLPLRSANVSGRKPRHRQALKRKRSVEASSPLERFQLAKVKSSFAFWPSFHSRRPLGKFMSTSSLSCSGQLPR
jgi:hypothetical protein